MKLKSLKKKLKGQLYSEIFCPLMNEYQFGYVATLDTQISEWVAPFRVSNLTVIDF